MQKSRIVFILIILILSVSINQTLAFTQLERVDIINPHLENSFGSPISDKVNINQQVQISSDIKNNQDNAQKFVYIVQIKNQYDVIIKVDWISGSLNPRQTFKTSLSWTPNESAVYTAEIYVWSSLMDRDALSEFKIFKITI